MKSSLSVFALVASVAGSALVFSGCSKQAEAPKTGAAAVSSGAPAGAGLVLPVIANAPAWKLKDVNGAEVTSEQFKGKVVVVDFWATWCGPCRAEIPGYVELMKKYGKDGLVIVGVSIDQGGPTVVKAFGEKFGINYPLVMGDDDVAAAFGGMSVVPTTFLIDRAGKIRDRKEGSEEVEVYEKKILAVLK